MKKLTDLLAIACTTISISTAAQTNHALKPTPKTFAWGYYDEALTVKPADTAGKK